MDTYIENDCYFSDDILFEIINIFYTRGYIEKYKNLFFFRLIDQYINTIRNTTIISNIVVLGFGNDSIFYTDEKNIKINCIQLVYWIKCFWSLANYITLDKKEWILINDKFKKKV